MLVSHRVFQKAVHALRRLSYSTVLGLRNIVVRELRPPPDQNYGGDCSDCELSDIGCADEPLSSE